MKPFLVAAALILAVVVLLLLVHVATTIDSNHASTATLLREILAFLRRHP